ncbi:unnamed protein product [Symbiodinium sp. CCMP2592]|nr:unnamed protein product [Symbiodinium sp. CCMP2592]
MTRMGAAQDATGSGAEALTFAFNVPKLSRDFLSSPAYGLLARSLNLHATTTRSKQCEHPNEASEAYRRWKLSWLLKPACRSHHKQRFVRRLLQEQAEPAKQLWELMLESCKRARRELSTDQTVLCNLELTCDPSAMIRQLAASLNTSQTDGPQPCQRQGCRSPCMAEHPARLQTLSWPRRCCALQCFSGFLTCAGGTGKSVPKSMRRYYHVQIWLS